MPLGRCSYVVLARALRRLSRRGNSNRPPQGGGAPPKHPHPPTMLDVIVVAAVGYGIYTGRIRDARDAARLLGRFVGRAGAWVRKVREDAAAAAARAASRAAAGAPTAGLQESLAQLGAVSAEATSLVAGMRPSALREDVVAAIRSANATRAAGVQAGGEAWGGPRQPPQGAAGGPELPVHAGGVAAGGSLSAFSPEELAAAMQQRGAAGGVGAPAGLAAGGGAGHPLAAGGLDGGGWPSAASGAAPRRAVVPAHVTAVYDAHSSVPRGAATPAQLTASATGWGGAPAAAAAGGATTGGGAPAGASGASSADVIVAILRREREAQLRAAGAGALGGAAPPPGPPPALR